MNDSDRNENSESRSWLVKIEILSMLLLDTALIPLALVALIAFGKIAIDAGLGTELPGSPFPPDHELSPNSPLTERSLSPESYTLLAAALLLPTGFLLGIAILLHRWVVRPLAED